MFTVNLTNLYYVNTKRDAMHISARKHSLVDVHSYKVSVRHRSEHDYSKCHID